MGNCASCETKAEKTARQKKKDGKQPEQGSGAVVGGPSSPDVIDLGTSRGEDDVLQKHMAGQSSKYRSHA
ncbi:hypothetical protein MGN70_013109 [Eutypa lata]|nr:hypothetical protein MGN70_013109 [Eutypa lata]